MKVSIGFRLQPGPWGGGNRFCSALVGALEGGGHAVRQSLDDRDIDVILLMDPRWRHPAVTFRAGDILRYLMFVNSRAIVVHRINECDERKNTRTMNALLRRANYCADHTVFVSRWLSGLPLWRGSGEQRQSVIRNGADARVFHSRGWRAWQGAGPLRLVTHHWGGNWMKGFDIYERLDRMLARPEWSGRIAFTYVGNLPSGFAFEHARHVKPLDGAALAAELRSHHAYLTASMNEPGGNHQNEGALCGLPLLYRRSGCLPEYCEGFGVSFDETDFESRLEDLIATYTRWAQAMPAYPHTAERMCAQYIRLFDELTEAREAIVGTRRLWRQPVLMLRNQVPV